MRLEELNALSEDPALWNDPEKAQKIMDAFYMAREKGQGVIAVGSKMIDLPVVKRADPLVLALRHNSTSSCHFSHPVRDC